LRAALAKSGVHIAGMPVVNHVSFEIG
jgi:hypothetical protein